MFTPKLPLLYKSPIDYSSSERKTHYITPLSKVKSQYLEILNEYAKEPKPIVKLSTHQQNLITKKAKSLKNKESYERQLKDWDNPELLIANEKEFMMKDPYRTVFISRLPYLITELEISKNFQKFGIIESIRIIKDNVTNKSKGYGFLVFEREADAKTCVRELAPVGLRVTSEADKVSRTILVDIERGRLLKNWKPRRLGGGLGNRHYTKPNPLGTNNNASAAASGRRLYLSNNPYSKPPAQSQSYQPSGYQRASQPSFQRPAPTQYNDRPPRPLSYNDRPSNPSSVSATPVTLFSYTSRSSDSRSADSVREKYVSRSDRSIRSIRNN